MLNGIRQIFGKEMSRILRDKKMVFSVFLLPVIIMVVCCAVLTPVLLKLAFRTKTENAYADLHTSGLVDRIEENDQLDIVSDRLLDEHHKLRKGQR